MALEQLHDDLWVVSAPLRFLFLFPIGTRMTVVRLSTGELWLCSPVAINAGMGAELDTIGAVRHIVAPNRFHHLYVGPARERYPDARIYLAPGLAEKRPDLEDPVLLGHRPPSAWAQELDQQVLEGCPTFNEVSFFHRSSRTLILTDHLFHLDHHQNFIARTLGALLGVRTKPGFPRDARWFFVKDKASLRRSIDALLAWDFDRIVLTHGQNIERGGRAILEEAYQFLGSSSD